jgi:DNA-binding NtrC family response regulator
MSDNGTRSDLQPADTSAPAIYVVDDQEMVVMVVQELLKLQNLTSRAFRDPHEALQAFTDADPKPQLLLTDYAMEQMNGMELIERCKQIDPNLKTILYSGSVGVEIMEDYSTKPDRFIGKPFKPTALIAMVNEMLGR